MQTATYGTELNILKKVVEYAVTLQYYIPLMEIKVTIPTRIYCDNKDIIINTVEADSILNKKYLALAYYFYREYFSTNVVDIRWTYSKYNISNAITKVLGTIEFHTHMKKAMSKN